MFDFSISIKFRKKITPKRLIKFGFKNIISKFHNGQGVYVKDRHMNDCGKYSDTFYFDPFCSIITFTDCGNAGTPQSLKVQYMDDLEMFYNQHKAEVPYPDESNSNENYVYDSSKDFAAISKNEEALIINGNKNQAILEYKKRVGVTITESKEKVLKYVKENNLSLF